MLIAKQIRKMSFLSIPIVGGSLASGFLILNEGFVTEAGPHFARVNAAIAILIGYVVGVALFFLVSRKTGSYVIAGTSFVSLFAQWAGSELVGMNPTPYAISALVAGVSATFLLYLLASDSTG